jgi:insulysin
MTEPSHPYHRFPWGDARSLSARPEARGVDMRAELTAFHAQHYSANLMSLVVLGQEPLDTLQAWVSESCAPVPNRRVPRPSFGDSPLPLSSAAPGSMPRWLRTTPLQEGRTLDLFWFVPSLLDRYHAARPLSRRLDLGEVDL